MKKLALICCVIGLLSCEDKQNNLENLDKKSAREVTLTTVTKNDIVYHLTKQIIWVNGEKLVEKTDTIQTKLVESTWEVDSSKIKKLNTIPIFVTVQ